MGALRDVTAPAPASWRIISVLADCEAGAPWRYGDLQIPAPRRPARPRVHAPAAAFVLSLAAAVSHALATALTASVAGAPAASSTFVDAIKANGMLSTFSGSGAFNTLKAALADAAPASREAAVVSIKAVSYTHLTLPTKRIV